MKPLHVVLAVFICMIWGVNFVAAKDAVAYFPSIFLLAIRLSIAALILLPFIKKPKASFKELLKISTVFTVFHFGFMFLALEHGLNVSVAVVVDQLRVPLAVMMGYFMFNETIDKKGIAGIATAILGTLVIVGTPNISGNYMAFFMMVSASFAWAFYNIQIKNLAKLDLFSFIGWMALLGAPQLFVVSFILEGNQFPLLLNPPLSAVLSLLYIAIGATIIAHGLWYYLLKVYPVNKVVPYTLLTPLFGMSAGIIMLNEEITWHIVIGGVLTLIGVAIVVIRKPKSAKAGDVT